VRFRVAQQNGLSNALSPFRVVQQSGVEVEWINRFLDQQRVRGVADSTLRSYAHDLLHFLRWWAAAHKTTAITKQALTESTFLDYIRFQVDQNPPPAAQSVNRRVGFSYSARAEPHSAIRTCFRRQ
jgi:site-specific recombinase XerD